MRVPLSNGGGAKFRGPTSSQDYNKNEDDKYLDLLELYRQSNTNLQRLTESHLIVLAENRAANNYINMLEKRLVEMEKKVAALGGSAPYKTTLTQTAFVQDMKIRYPNISQENADASMRCDVDLHHRYATIPLISQIPKTHVVNEKNGEVVVPNELGVKVGRSNAGGEVVDNNLYNCFNGDNESYWQRTVTYDLLSCPDEEDVVIEVELPSHLVNNLYINTIQLHPHPERGVQVKNIEILYQNAWQQIAGFTQQDITAVNSNEFTPRRKWFFPSVPVNKIRITLVQKFPLDINGKKVFVLGAQEIGVFLSLFETGGGTILTPIEMDNSVAYDIESIEHVFLNRNAFSFDKNLDHLMEGNIVEYEILKEEIDGMLTPLRNNEWSGLFAKRLWIKTKLYSDPYNGVNPCLHAVRLHYST